ncbi:MAG: hypothetical protein ACYTGC_10900 [Planctomycetota bacterium]|jgi:hypothetical protein
MPWVKWTIVAAAFLTAGWWVFDGAHAMVTGDLVTPRSGRFAGQYGPWARPVSAVGIDPHGRGMHAAFLVLGLAWLVVIGGWIVDARWAWWAMTGFAVFSLWYLPFGTVPGLLQVALLIGFRRRLIG